MTRLYRCISAARMMRARVLMFNSHIVVCMMRTCAYMCARARACMCMPKCIYVHEFKLYKFIYMKSQRIIKREI